MVRFAHLSDVHLGAFRELELRELNIRAFEMAVDVCLERKVDFVVIAGDFFDIALPEMGVVDRAVRKMREAQETGVKFYLVYGSHDYSPTETSVIDVLCSAGVLVKVSAFERPAGGEDGKRALKVFWDEKTGVSICGISARARGLEEADFEKIDFSPLESVPSPKIFVFHSAISEYAPEELKGFGGGVPIAALPRGFDYYASGHVHLAQEIRDPVLGRKPLVFPGPLFASDYRDLEDLSLKKHGFWVCDLGEDGSARVERVDLDVCRVVFLDFDASGKNSVVVSQELLELVGGQILEGKIVLLKVRGVLQHGSNPNEVDFASVRAKAAGLGARVFYLNRNALKAVERAGVAASLADAGGIQEGLFEKSLAALNLGEDLRGARGLALSKKLLGVLKAEAQAGEAKGDFEARVVREAKKVFDSEARKGQLSVWGC